MLQRTVSTIRPIVAAAFIAVLSPALYAGQRTYAVGVSGDVTGGGVGPDISGLSNSQNPGHFVTFFGTFPSLTLTARGEHSSLDSSYAFGYNQYNSNPRTNSRSHAASLGYSTEIGPKWRFRLSDSFAETSDISSFHLLSGTELASVPTEFQYIFNPVFTRNNQSNTASLSFDHEINKRSTLNFGVTDSFLMYGADQQFSGILSDQQRYSANAGYTRIGERSSWSFGYSGTQFRFDSFSNARSHAVSIGYSHQLSPELSYHLSGGPSYLEHHELVNHPVNFSASFSLQRKVQHGGLSLSVSHSGNDSSGLGSITNSEQTGFGMNHTMSRKMTLSADVSGFDTRANTAGSQSSRGVSAGASVGYAIARRWFMNWGGQYQRYLGNSLFVFNQKRLFLSLRYNNPELWRFQR